MKLVDFNYILCCKCAPLYMVLVSTVKCNSYFTRGSNGVVTKTPEASAVYRLIIDSIVWNIARYVVHLKIECAWNELAAVCSFGTESVVKQQTKTWHTPLFRFSYVILITHASLRISVRGQHKLDKIKEIEGYMGDK
jgi:hypothetical protein